VSGKRRCTSEEERDIKAVRSQLDIGIQHVVATINGTKKTVDRVSVAVLVTSPPLSHTMSSP
jgi:hypothetical protein